MNVQTKFKKEKADNKSWYLKGILLHNSFLIMTYQKFWNNFQKR